MHFHWNASLSIITQKEVLLGEKESYIQINMVGLAIKIKRSIAELRVTNSAKETITIKTVSHALWKTIYHLPTDMFYHLPVFLQEYPSPFSLLISKRGKREFELLSLFLARKKVWDI